EGLHWGFAKTPATLMGSVFVVAPDPLVEILLQLGDRAVDALAERYPVELVQHCFVEALDDSIGLRALGLGSGVVHILDREIELVLVVLGVSAIFRASVGQHAAQPDLVLIIEGHHTVVEEIGRGERGLAIVELRVLSDWYRRGQAAPAFWPDGRSRGSLASLRGRRRAAAVDLSQGRDQRLGLARRPRLLDDPPGAVDHQIAVSSSDTSSPA